MGIGVSIFLIVLGAIFVFGFDFEARGLNLDAIGTILMLAGVLGLALTLFYWRPRRRRQTVVERRAVPVVEDRIGHTAPDPVADTVVVEEPVVDARPEAVADPRIEPAVQQRVNPRVDPRIDPRVPPPPGE